MEHWPIIYVIAGKLAECGSLTFLNTKNGEDRVVPLGQQALNNLHDIRGNTETVANAIADVCRRVAERDASEPSWFVRRAERLLDAPPTPPVIPSQPIQTED